MSISNLTILGLASAISERMLQQPEPEYFWANLAFGAVQQMELRMLANLGATLAGAPAGQMPPSMPGTDINKGHVPFAEAIYAENITAAPKQLVYMKRRTFADTTYTEASRNITRAVIGSGGVDLTQDQVAMTIQRNGGPYSSTSSAVLPHWIESFDLRTNSQANMLDEGYANLGRDRKKFVDSVIGTKFCTGAAATTTGRVYAGDSNDTLSADDTAFVTQGDRTMDIECLSRAIERAQNNKIPTFPNGRYCVVLTPRQVRQLSTTSAWRSLSEKLPETNPLTAKYVRTYNDADIYVSQSNPTATANSTITVQLGVLFGPGALGYALASPCQVVVGDDTNFQQRVGLLWTADEAFEILDNRFLVSIRSD